ncbi:hypothetical protein SESBI_05613 [Sesbania bispinosa]|nr:hypothetical protein SESBI_05613 [Sesbania bispinosa]
MAAHDESTTAQSWRLEISQQQRRLEAVGTATTSHFAVTEGAVAGGERGGEMVTERVRDDTPAAARRRKKRKGMTGVVRPG